MTSSEFRVLESVEIAAAWLAKNKYEMPSEVSHSLGKVLDFSKRVMKYGAESKVTCKFCQKRFIINWETKNARIEG